VRHFSWIYAVFGGTVGGELFVKEVLEHAEMVDHRQGLAGLRRRLFVLQIVPSSASLGNWKQ